MSVARRSKLPMGTVTFLFSDIEGSTRLVQDVGPDVYRSLLETHQGLLRAAFVAHGGVERGTQGDSFTVIFETAPAAVAAAIDAQRAIAAHAWPVGSAVRVRIGVHTGVGLAGGDDYVGLDIHRAARIASVAHGGQTLMSDATRALAAQELPAGTTCLDLGEHRLKDLAVAEHLFEVGISGLTTTFPPLRTTMEAGNLPDRLTTFVGRRRELDELESLLEGVRLLTIVGPGGVGKTSLAIEVARRRAARYADGPWLVRLESVADVEQMAAAIVEALGLVDAGSRTYWEQLRDHAAGRQILLVLDNLEQVRGAGPRLASFLESAPGVVVMATSRSPLRVAGEQVFQLEPLRTSRGDSPDESDAAALFVDRARRVRPGYIPDPADRAAIASICRHMDGLPLGIELAAARVRLLPVPALAARIERHLELPGQGAAGAPSRQRSLTDAIAWSHDLLDLPARRMFARFSVFAGGCRLDEAEAVLGMDPAVGTDVLGGVADLVDQSLVIPGGGVDGPRFRMLETIRAFAGARLADSGELPALRRAHALTYLAQAESEARHLPGRGQQTRLTRLTEDHDNLRAAMAWAIVTEDADVALRFAAAMWRFWQLRGHLDEGHRLVTALLGVPGADRDDSLRMRAVEAAGGIAYWRGDRQATADHYADQLRISIAIGDRQGEADANFNLAHVRGDDVVGLIEGPLNRAGAIYEELGDERGLARVDWGRAQTELASRGPETVGRFLALLSRFEALDDALYVQITTGALAWWNFAAGNMDEAARWCHRGLRICWEAGDWAQSTFDLRAAAVLASLRARYVDAATLLGACDELARTFAIRPPVVLETIVGHSRIVETLGSRLDAETLARARATGAAMSLDEAVDFALRGMDPAAT